MELRLKNANIYKNGSFIKKDFPLDSFISAGSFTGIFSDFDNIYVLSSVGGIIEAGDFRIDILYSL